MLREKIGRWLRLILKGPAPAPAVEQPVRRPDVKQKRPQPRRPQAKAKPRGVQPGPDATRQGVAILTIRDNESGQVVELRELAGHERQNVAPIYAAMRKKYPPPRYDLVIGMAASMEAFLKSYPRFRQRGKTRGGGGDDGNTRKTQPA